MKIDTASSFTKESTQQQTTFIQSSDDMLKGLRVIQVEPEDDFESTLMALHLQSEPAILLLPEQSQAFSDLAHFEQLRQICTPERVSLVLPKNRINALSQNAHQYGFFLASSMEQAAQFLLSHEGEHQRDSEVDQPETNETSLGKGQQSPGTSEIQEQQVASPVGPPQATDPSVNLPLTSLPRILSTRRISLLTTMIAFLIIVGVVLLPALFSEQPRLTGTMQPAAVTTTVGQVAFTSSGQLDPISSKGLNDIVTINLYHLSTPTSGNAFYAWLMPDKHDDMTKPLLLGKLSIEEGKAQRTYTHPDHQNLLASYSGFLVAEQENNPQPTTPPLNPKDWRYVGSIPNTPTPGDEQQYSLLSHIRHLLAKEPTLQQIGLQGGFDIWLFRNAGKILEWSTAARDNWADGQTDLIHRHMIRVLQYLDGTTYAYTSGDLSVDTPLLVDPQIGRIGLLEVSQAQQLPTYLEHVDLHLNGLVNSPGHTETQKQLAIQIDKALKQVMNLMRKIRQDAFKLVKMENTQLRGNDTLALLNDMVTSATDAYIGQPDSKTGGYINGIVWIHSQLQGLATIPVTTPPGEQK